MPLILLADTVDDIGPEGKLGVERTVGRGVDEASAGSEAVDEDALHAVAVSRFAVIDYFVKGSWILVQFVDVGAHCPFAGRGGALLYLAALFAHAIAGVVANPDLSQMSAGLAPADSSVSKG